MIRESDRSEDIIVTERDTETTLGLHLVAGDSHYLVMASMEVEDTKPSRLSVLYPLVDETVTPLPRGWSCIDKFSYIELSHNNLRVHYTGVCGVSVHVCACVHTISCTYM